MKAVEFEYQSDIIEKDSEVYLPLPLLRFDNDPHGTIITCWEMSEEERDEFLKTGRLYVSLLTFNKPISPMSLSVRIEDFIDLK